MSCKDCVSFHRYADTLSDAGDAEARPVGECRRRSPERDANGLAWYTGVPNALWPTVREDMRCGEFEVRK